MASEYRGEVRPRRSPVRHHFVMSSSAHRTPNVSDPFPPISNSEFPSLYIRSPLKNLYRRYMRSTSFFQQRLK